VPEKAAESAGGKGSAAAAAAADVVSVPASGGRFSHPPPSSAAAASAASAAPGVDPSLAWAAAGGARRFAVSALLAMRDGEGCTDEPEAFGLAEPIAYPYEEKVKDVEYEELLEANELARNGGNGNGGGNGSARGTSDRGPMRPKAPPKEYKKPGWAAGLIEGDDAEVMRTARSLLNKLTVEKFDRLAGEFAALHFTSAPLLEAAVELVLDKAQMEQHFGAMYADLCLKMAKTQYANLGDDDPDKPKAFKKILLQKAQVKLAHTRHFRSLTCLGRNKI
jgi:hypothetical protein